MSTGNEAENPAPPHQHNKKAPRKDAPPSLEQDSQDHTIPLSQRTQEDREKARTGRRDR